MTMVVEVPSAMNVWPNLSDAGFLSGSEAGGRNVRALSPEMAGVMSMLLHLVDQRGSIVVYLGAASRGEGTTTVARALSVAATHWDWCKVALVDACPPPEPGGTYPATAGLLDVTDETADLAFRRPQWSSAPLMEAPLLGLHASVPRVDTVRTLFGRLRKLFTLIIVDGPPILASQEIAAFSAAADCVLLVVEAERTRVPELERARATLEQFGARILGIVLNRRRHRIPKFLGRRI